MTEFEKLQLRLLAEIMTGVGLLVARSTVGIEPEPANDQLVLEWSRKTAELIDETVAATSCVWPANQL